MAVTTISEALSLAKDYDTEDPDSIAALTLLEDYECWEPYLRFVKILLKDPHSDQVSLRISLFKALFKRLSRKGEAVSFLCETISRCSLDYNQLVTLILMQPGWRYSFQDEGEILYGCWKAFAQKLDKIKALERLCLIFEKKIYDTTKLHDCYDLLIELDSQNIRALRFFKVWHEQSGEYGTVVEMLQRLVQINSPALDKHRLTLELASIQLYQLGDAASALKTLSSITLSDRLDVSTILFESNYELGNWLQCVDVLKVCLGKVTAPKTKAVLLFKMGEVHERLGAWVEATACYREVVELDSSFLEAYESLIDIAVREGDWFQVLEFLARLKGALNNRLLIDGVAQLSQRILSGLNNAS